MFKELIGEYKETKEQLKKLRGRKKSQTVANLNEISLVDSMLRDVDWNIDYMEEGFSKDAFRGIHRREIPMDPQVMAQLFAQKAILSREAMYSQGAKMKAWGIFNTLTPREREAFWLIKVECLSYSEAAKEMGYKKGNVYNLIIRAQEKIKKMVEIEIRENTLAVVG